VGLIELSLPAATEVTLAAETLVRSCIVLPNVSSSRDLANARNLLTKIRQIRFCYE